MGRWGQPFRFWGLGHGNLGFRGGTWGQPFRFCGLGTWGLGVGLGFGGWDMGLGAGLGDNPLGFRGRSCRLCDFFAAPTTYKVAHILHVHLLPLNPRVTSAPATTEERN